MNLFLESYMGFHILFFLATVHSFIMYCYLYIVLRAQNVASMKPTVGFGNVKNFFQTSKYHLIFIKWPYWAALPSHFHYQLSLYFLMLFNHLHRGLYCSLWFISVCCCASLKIMKKWNEKSHLLSAEKNIFKSLSGGGSSQEQQQHQYTEVN